MNFCCSYCMRVHSTNFKNITELEKFIGTCVRGKQLYIKLKIANYFPILQKITPRAFLRYKEFWLPLFLLIMHDLANNSTIPIIPSKKRIITKLMRFWVRNLETDFLFKITAPTMHFESYNSVISRMALTGQNVLSPFEQILR
jgi:hypothetical protein